MALRFLLVGVVASLGMELPNRHDLDSWAQVGREWVNAQVTNLADFNRTVPPVIDCEEVTDAHPLPLVATQVPNDRDDLTFDAVVEGMAANFATDLALLVEPVAAEATILAEVPVPFIPEVGWRDPEPNLDVLSELVPAQIAPVAIIAPEIESNSRVERISTAMRLTRDAMNAWISLIQVPAVRVATDNAVDSL